MIYRMDVLVSGTVPRIPRVRHPDIPCPSSHRSYPAQNKPSRIVAAGFVTTHRPSCFVSELRIWPPVRQSQSHASTTPSFSLPSASPTPRTLARTLSLVNGIKLNIVAVAEVLCLNQHPVPVVCICVRMKMACVTFGLCKIETHGMSFHRRSSLSVVNRIVPVRRLLRAPRGRNAFTVAPMSSFVETPGAAICSRPI